MVIAIAIKLLTSMSTTFSIMCWLTETFHTTCSHWGKRLVQTPCARGENSATGCWDNTISGVLRLQVLCPACRHDRRISESTTPSLTFTHHTQSSEEAEPLSRKSIGSKPLMLENRILDKIAAKKEGELVDEWEGTWEMVEVEGGKESRESEGGKESGAAFGKWIAWRGYKV